MKRGTGDREDADRFVGSVVSDDLKSLGLCTDISPASDTWLMKPLSRGRRPHWPALRRAA
jgi:hypothetical protein